MNKAVCVCLLMLIASKMVYATPFGIFNPRSMAMGGTGVASASVDNAVFYNPALLAQYTVDEDEGRNSICIFPVLSVRFSETVDELEKFRQKDYDSKLSQAISAFNASGGAVTDAQGVLDASENLQDGLSRVSDGPMFVDALVAFTINIPGMKQGGAFLYSKHALGDGEVIKSLQDEKLLVAYNDTMRFLATGQNQPAQDVMDLVLADNGQLLDHTGNLTSSVTATGIILTELGLSVAGNFSIFKRDVMLGVTPKFIKADTYATQTNVNNQLEGTQKSNPWAMTADIGAAKIIKNDLKVGLTVKNIIPLEYTTSLGSQISIAPQVRVGTAYQTSWGMLTFDFDVLENSALGAGDNSQYALFGAEWAFKWGKLLGGYNYNFSATGSAKQGVFSAGIQLSPFGMILELAYAANSVERAAALQTGFNF